MRKKGYALTSLEGNDWTYETYKYVDVDELTPEEIAFANAILTEEN